MSTYSVHVKLFVGGDLSGIQKFLYNITSRHASVSLKGRSAFLSNYLRKVCDRIEYTIEGNGVTVKKLYCSGGKFYLITDNTPAVCKAIDDYAKVVKEELWNEHRGQLGINISHVAYREEDGKFIVEGHEDDQNISSGVLWKYCNADFARQKNQKFKELLIGKYHQFFDVQKVGGVVPVCALTGVESPDCRPLTEEDFKKKGLSLAEYIEEKDSDDVSDNAPVYLPSVINQIVLGKTLSKKYGTKTFEQYATTDEGVNNGIEGDTYLGILRMDIDGMGKRFIIGFDTLKEYENFSGKVTNFFEGRIIKDKEGKTVRRIPSAIEILLDKHVAAGAEAHKYKEYVNVIYAGGDDLFIIGRWDRLVDFAKIIHDAVTCPEGEFLSPDYYFERTYIDVQDSNKEKHISISGGIAIVKPKFPIAKAAEMAGEAEEAAKDYREEKNTFNLFGKTVTWESEFDEVEQYKDELIRVIRDVNDGKGKSLLHKLMLYGEIANKNEQPGVQPNYSYIWHSAYYMKRYQERYRHEDVKKLCSQLSRGITDHRTLQLITIAARWAELLLR